MSALTTLLTGCGHGGAASPAQPTAAQQVAVVVSTAAVQHRPVQRGIDVTGSLFGDDETTVSAKAAGRVVSVLADLGDRVEPGQLLAQVDRTDYELTKVQREAAMHEALARLGLEELPAEDFDLATLPTVRRAQAEEANAQSRLLRGKQLYENDPPLISDQEYADLQTALEIASRDVAVEMLAARALLSQARTRASELAVAEQALRDTEIRAPEASVQAGQSVGYEVARRLVSVGEYVSEGQAAFTLVDADPIKFRAEVPERYTAVVRVDQRVSIDVEAYGEAFVGAVKRLSPRVDPASRTFLIEAEIPNADGRLKPGSFARGRIDTTMDTDIPFVPAEAVVSFAGVKRIFTVEQGKAVEHRIQTGVEVDGLVEVIGANLPGDAQVIVEGATKVANGTAVTVKEPPAAGRAQADGAARVGS